MSSAAGSVVRDEIVSRLHLLAGGVLLALTAVGFVKIPAAPGLAMHWGPDGHPDVLWPRNDALVLFPALGVLLLIIGLIASRFVAVDDERRRGLATALLIGLGLLAALQLGFVLIGTGSDIDLVRIVGFLASVAMILRGVVGARHSDLPMRRPAAVQARARVLERATRAVFVPAGLGLLWAVYSWSDPLETLRALAVAVIVPALLVGLFRLLLRPAT